MSTGVSRSASSSSSRSSFDDSTLKSFQAKGPGQRVVMSAWAALLGDDGSGNEVDGTETLVPRVAATAPNLVQSPSSHTPQAVLTAPAGVVRPYPDGGVVVDVSYGKAVYLKASLVDQDDTCMSLHTCYNKLTEVPAEVKRLRRLKVLDLSFNQLGELSDVVGVLAELTELDLRSNVLESLPNALKSCNKLTRLYLHRNKLQDLPDVFENMRSLQVVDASCNSIETIAKSLWSLGTSLRQLNLERNNLSEIPGAIGSLRSVVKLSLAHNRIRRLPVDLGKLVALEELDLSFNSIERLPSDTLGKLVSLRELSFRGNGFSDLPIDIADLARLESLDLLQSQVKMLPLECARLKALEHLLVDVHSFVRPPPDVCRRGVEAMLKYLESARQANIPADGTYSLTGEGLSRTVEAAQMLSFMINATDSKQRPLPIVPGSLSVQVDVIQAPDEADETMASLPVKVTLADEQLGTLVASYDATVAGHYIIRVMTGPKTHLPGSPFHVNVTCGPLHPPSCVVVRSSDLKMPPGSALSWTALVLPAGKEDTFTVLRCDKFGNRIPLAGNSNTPAEELSVQLIEASPRPADPSKALKLTIVKAQSGPTVRRDVISVVGMLAGRYRIAVALQGAALRASPLDLTVTPGPVSPAQCTISVTGTRSAVLNTETSFVIQARDAFGNARTAGTDVFDAMITTVDSNVAEYPVSVLDNQNGEHVATYCIKSVGVFLLHVRLQRRDNGTLVPIHGSPFQISVTDRKTLLQDQFEVENLLLSTELAQMTQKYQALQSQVQQSEKPAAPGPSSVNNLRKVFEKVAEAGVVPESPTTPEFVPAASSKKTAASALISSSSGFSDDAFFVAKEDQDQFVTYLLRRTDRLPLMPWPSELLAQTIVGISNEGESTRADEIVSALLEQLGHLVKTESMDVRELGFWLSNLIHLANRLTSWSGTAAISPSLLQGLKDLSNEVVRVIAKVVQARLSANIVRAFFDQTDDGNGNDSGVESAATTPAPAAPTSYASAAATPRHRTAQPQGTAPSVSGSQQAQSLDPVMGLIHATLTHLETSAIPAETVNALLSQWMFYIDAVLLNSLLIRKKCSAVFLNTFTWTLSQWESWIMQRRNGFVLTVTGGPATALLDRNKTLIRTNQALRLLQTPRLASREPNDVVKHVTHLNVQQVQKLLSTLDDFKISPAKQNAIVDAMQRQGTAAPAPLLSRQGSSPVALARVNSPPTGSPAAAVAASEGDGLFVDTFHVLPIPIQFDAPIAERVILPSRMVPPMVQRIAHFV